MYSFFKSQCTFLLLFTIVFATIGIALLNIDKTQLHLLLNSCHTAFGDVFFRLYTTLADYGIYIMAIGLLFWRAGGTIYMLASQALGAIITQIIKHIVNAPRPKIVFNLAETPDALPIVEGVRMHSCYSFPSGHTCSFFILFFSLSVIVWYYNQNRQAQRKQTYLYAILQIACFILALTGGYSRIYLSQHFTLDVFVGGIIGVCSIIALYPAFVWFNNKYPNVCAWHISLSKRQNR